jgi:hypothetical protein
MKKIKYLILLAAMAVSFGMSSCVVRARGGVYVRGHYEYGPYGGRHWVRGHYN